MLASLLCNPPVVGIPGRRNKFERGIVNGKYLMVAGYETDVTLDITATIAKDIVRAVHEIKLPKETQAEVKDILQAYRFKKASGNRKAQVNYELLTADYVAYNRLVDILLAHTQEEEEMALIMMMMGIE